MPSSAVGRIAGAVAAVAFALATSCVPHDDPNAVHEELHLTGFDISGADQTGYEGDTLPEPVTGGLMLSDGSYDVVHTVWVTIRSGNGGILLPRSRGYGNGVTLGGVQGGLTLQWVMGPSDEPQVLRFWTLGDDTVYTDVHATSLPPDTT